MYFLSLREDGYNRKKFSVQNNNIARLKSLRFLYYITISKKTSKLMYLLNAAMKTWITNNWSQAMKIYQNYDFNSWKKMFEKHFFRFLLKVSSVITWTAWKPFRYPRSKIQDLSGLSFRHSICSNHLTKKNRFFFVYSSQKLGAKFHLSY